jgi:hypothetical protein
MELYDAQSALHTFEFIISHGAAFLKRMMNNDQNELTDYDKQKLIDLVPNHSGRETLADLMGKFVEFFSIYLSFIAFEQGKFRIINKYSFPDKTKQRNQAFVVLNGDNTFCGPLFAHDLTGRIQTVFDFDDIRIAFQVQKYIEKLNQTGKFYSFLK